ncbi:GntR family transcriptional regulator [Nakamurella leprariae]|uniref:GntR family transcriptional regulator n=1 Tax=Nakamurella leprariae TaxID=2803911 RepID=A0A939C133_9ACTN|nr:GntR family transcriptional regulator [Nakamurella leprariae]MBM9466704.1 GntR family transcriptional regulator [Nakamurella leprariae]
MSLHPGPDELAPDEARPDDNVRDLTQIQLERLRDEILEGLHPPGTVLLETVLSKRYGVSRTPVREALGRLQNEGWLERSTRGFVVRRRDPEEILEIYGVRILLEAASAEQAATNRTEFDLQRLDFLTEERFRVETVDAARDVNMRWHRALRRAAHNETLARLLTDLDALLRIYHGKRRPDDAPDPAVSDHGAIVQAVRERDGDLARVLMSAHLRRARDERVQAMLPDQE